MDHWKGIIGASFTPAGFDHYCHSLTWAQWRPGFVALHNTEIPTLAARPHGLSKQHILNLEHYYRYDVRPGPWNAGPHLFVDDRQIWVFTPLTDLELATEAHGLSQRATANRATLLKDYNLTAADLQKLGEDAQSFTAQLTAPQLAIDARKIQGATAKTTLSALNVFLKDDLRAGMELLKDTHRDAYDALREASQVDDAAYRKKKKKRAGREAGDNG